MPDGRIAGGLVAAENLAMVRFPRSSTSRKSGGHLRLVSSVDLSAPAGLQLRGRFARPGSEIELEALPRPALVLEDAGRVCDPAARTLAERRRSFASLWILWRFDFDALRWIEVIRTTANDAGFSLDFAIIAARLFGGRSEAVHAAEARPVAARLIDALEAGLADVSCDAGCFVLAEIETYLANQIVRRIEARSARMIERAGARFLASPEVLRLGA